MKNLLILGGLVFFAACTKTADRPAEENPSSTTQTEKESCDFGITQFNLTKRAPVDDPSANKPPHAGGGNGGGGGSTGGGGTTTTTNGVILLDFDGQYVSGTSWNGGVPFTCAPANLTSDAVALIIERVTNDYSPFNVTVTTDEAVFNAASINKRTRAIITESWEWYGQVGGVAFINSFTNGSGNPCFIFSSLLSYSTKHIGEAAAHEVGHTMGLRHQSVYDANGVKVSEYNYGQGSGETGWAPIMGVGYYQNLTLWHRGPNSLGASYIQDDVSILSSVLGFKTDDYSNTATGAAVLSSSLNGTISNNTDVDYFSVNTSVARTLALVPSNVGAGNSGANEDLILKIYNSQGGLIAVIDDAGILNATASLAPGSYYVSVGTTANSYTTTYGMLGKYTVSIY